MTAELKGLERQFGPMRRRSMVEMMEMAAERHGEKNTCPSTPLHTGRYVEDGREICAFSCYECLFEMHLAEDWFSNRGRQSAKENTSILQRCLQHILGRKDTFRSQ